MPQPQDAALTAILRGLMERHGFMAASGADPAALGQALGGTIAVLTPLVRVELARLDELDESGPAEVQALPQGSAALASLAELAQAPSAIGLGAMAARILGKPAMAREVGDVELLLTRLTRPLGTENRVVLILVGADRLRADSFAYLQMAGDLTSRGGFQLHVVFVGGPWLWAVLQREGGRLSERVLIRADLTGSDGQVLALPAPSRPPAPAWQFGGRISLAAAVVAGAFFIGGDVAQGPAGANPAPQRLAQATTPDAEPPKAEAPAVVTPAPEPPKAEAAPAPVVEAPAPEPPKVEAPPPPPAPVVVAPTPEPPKVEAPPPAPVVVAPTPEPPKVEPPPPPPAPVVVAPTPEPPKVEAPPPPPAPVVVAPTPEPPKVEAPPPPPAPVVVAPTPEPPKVEAPPPPPAPVVVAPTPEPPKVEAPPPPPAPVVVAPPPPPPPAPVVVAPPPPAPVVVAPPPPPPPAPVVVAPPPPPPPAPVVVTPPPPPPPAPVVAAPPPPPPNPATQAMLDMMQRRGDEMLATGDVSAARRYYERGATARSGRAAYALARTYDPRVLATLGVKGVPADVPTAARLYREATALGIAEARPALDGLLALTPDELARLR